MEENQLCIVCLAPIPKTFGFVRQKSTPHPTCCTEHKLFASNRHYASPEELQTLWSSLVRQKAAIQQFVYAGATPPRSNA